MSAKRNRNGNSSIAIRDVTPANIRCVSRAASSWKKVECLAAGSTCVSWVSSYSILSFAVSHYATIKIAKWINWTTLCRVPTVDASAFEYNSQTQYKSAIILNVFNFSLLNFIKTLRTNMTLTKICRIHLSINSMLTYWFEVNFDVTKMLSTTHIHYT